MGNPDAVNVYSSVVEFFCGDGYSPLKSSQHKIPGLAEAWTRLTFEKGKMQRKDSEGIYRLWKSPLFSETVEFSNDFAHSQESKAEFSSGCIFSVQC